MNRLRELGAKFLRVVVVRRVEPKRPRFRANQVIGGERRRERQVAAAGRIHEVERLARDKGSQNHAGVRAVRVAGWTSEKAADDGRDGAPALPRGVDKGCGGDDHVASRSLGDVLLGPRDEGDGGLVGLSRGVAPSDEAVSRPDHASRSRLGFERRRRGFCQLKSRRGVIEHNDLAAERLGRYLHAVRPIGQGEDGVGVRVVNESWRKKSMDEGFDRGRGRIGANEVRAKLIDHGGVVKRAERPQPA